MQNRSRVGLGFLAALLLATPAAAQGAAEKLPDGVTQAMIDKGKTIYGSTGLCFACHGAKAEGAVGPKLIEHEFIHSKGTYPEIVAFVTAGVTKEKAKSGIMMPAKGGSQISDDDVKAVSAYVWAISRKK